MFNKILGVMFGASCLLGSFGSAGCQKAAPPAPPSDPKAPLIKNLAPAKDVGAVKQTRMELDPKSVELVLDAKKPVDAKVTIVKGMFMAIEGGKDGVSAKMDGGAIKITAAPDAKPGEQVITIRGMGDQKATVTVNVKGAGKADEKTAGDKKGDEKKADEKKAGDKKLD